MRGIPILSDETLGRTSEFQPLERSCLIGVKTLILSSLLPALFKSWTLRMPVDALLGSDLTIRWYPVKVSYKTLADRRRRQLLTQEVTSAD